MGSNHSVQQVLKLISRVRGTAVADNYLHDLFREIKLAGQRSLFEGHMEQCSHFPDNHGTERPFQRDPQTAGILFRGNLAALVAPGQETRGTGGKRQLMIVPEEDDIPLFHREPDPLVMVIQRPGSFFQHESPCRLDPRAAGLRQTARLVISFHRKGSQMIRDFFQQIGIHGVSS